MTPQRIQRRRTKGWKMPENTISVTRPGKWGNFLKLSGDMIMIDASYRRKNLDKWVFLCFGDLERLLEIYRLTMSGGGNTGGVIKLGVTSQDGQQDLLWWHYKLAYCVDELKGKHLACFCPIGSPCHAKILLKIANQ